MAPRILTALAYLVIPLIGLFLFGWDWRQIVLLYWLENVTLGIVTVVRMSRAEPPVAVPGQGPTITINGRPAGEMAPGMAKRFFTIFFVFHYGVFTLVHGIFVILIVSGVFSGLVPETAATRPLDWGWIVLTWLGVTAFQLYLAVFVEPRRTGHPAVAMLRPYGRVIPLHIAILGGVFLIALLNAPALVAVLLVLLHAVVDVLEILISRIRAAAARRGSDPVILQASPGAAPGAPSSAPSGTPAVLPPPADPSPWTPASPPEDRR